MKKLACVMPTLAKDEKINTLEYLKLAIKSFKYFSSDLSKLYVHVDGLYKPTTDFLEESGISYTQRLWGGQTKAFNQLILRAEEEFVFTTHDDLVFSPCWDKAILSWLKKDVMVTPWLLEPQHVGFGETPDTFDDERFLIFVGENAKHESLPRGIFLQAFSRDFFIDMGGYDENLFPYGLTDTDFNYRVMTERPEVKSIRIKDSIIYHFARGAKKKFEEHSEEYRWEDIGEKLDNYIQNKHGVTIGEIARKMREHWGDSN